jgi:C-terminal peptidase prc
MSRFVSDTGRGETGAGSAKLSETSWSELSTESANDSRIPDTTAFLEICSWLIRNSHINNPQFDLNIFHRALTLFAESIDPGRIVITQEDLKIPSSENSFLPTDKLLASYVKHASKLVATCQRRKGELSRWATKFDIRSVAQRDQETLGEPRWDGHLNMRESATSPDALESRWVAMARVCFLYHEAGPDRLKDLKGHFDKKIVPRWIQNIASPQKEQFMERLASAMARSFDPHTEVRSGNSELNIFATKALNPRDEVQSKIVKLPSHLDPHQSKVGYIEIPLFYEGYGEASGYESEQLGASKHVELALNNFRAEGVDVVILDLSRNPGGSAAEVLKIANLFMDRPNLATFIERFNTYSKGSSRKTLWEGPLVVVTSGASASGSEMLAAAVKSYGRGIVVGEPTYGKGTMQKSFFKEVSLASNFRLPMWFKVTNGLFAGPTGGKIQHLGVQPDVYLRIDRPHNSCEAKRPHSLMVEACSGLFQEVNPFGLAGDAVVSELIKDSEEYVERTAQLQVLKDLLDGTEPGDLDIPLDYNSFMSRRREKQIRRQLWPLKSHREQRRLDDLSNPVARIVLRLAARYRSLLDKRDNPRSI